MGGTVLLMAKILQLAPRHFVELPDRPWIEHVYQEFGTAKAFLNAAVEASGKQWSFVGPLCVSEWYGHRELWLLEEARQSVSALPWHGLKSLFPKVLGVSPESSTAGPVSTTAFRRTMEVNAATQPMPTAPASGQQQALNQANFASQQADLGAALLAAPTALIAAHVQMRDAVSAAEAMLQDSRT